MLYTRSPLRTLRLAIILAIVSATSARPNLFERASTCAANYTQCAQDGLPDNFCCSEGSSCNVLAGKTTVLCCPGGGDCTTIKTISCLLSLQDPKEHPTAAVKTTELSGKLPVCGNGCCPFGYHCDDDGGNCVIDTDQSKKPSQASTSSSTAVATATSSIHPSSTISTGTPSTSTAAVTVEPASPTSTEGSESSSTGVPPPSAKSNGMNTAGIIGGVVGGVVALSLIGCLLWWRRQKRRKAAAEEEDEKRDSTVSFGNIISAPIPHADYHPQRIDFLIKAQQQQQQQEQQQQQYHQQYPQKGSASPTPSQAQDWAYYQRHPKQQNSFPPNSPYSAAFFRPGSGMTDVPRSHHASAEVGGLRNLTDNNNYNYNSKYNNNHNYGNNNKNNSSNNNNNNNNRFTIPNPFASRDDRQSTAESININVFADPSTVGSSSPSIYGNNKRDTTWTEFQHHADRHEEPEMPSRRKI